MATTEKLNFIKILFSAVKNKVSTELKLQELKKVYNAHGDTPIRIVIYDDDGKTVLFDKVLKVGESTLEELKSVQPDAVATTNIGTLLNIVRGERTIVYKQNGLMVKESYSPLDAYLEGKLVITSNSKTKNYMGDLQLFQKIYMEILPSIQNQVNKK